jgi:hypothetical protein
MKHSEARRGGASAMIAADKSAFRFHRLQGIRAKAEKVKQKDPISAIMNARLKYPRDPALIFDLKPEMEVCRWLT